jgi:hypothetical protein
MENGTSVITDPVEGGWTTEALQNRKRGVSGRIVGKHDSHGACYDVLHEDGTIGCYERQELIVNLDEGYFPIVILDEETTPALSYIEKPEHIPVGRSFRVILTNANPESFQLAEKIFKALRSKL